MSTPRSRKAAQLRAQRRRSEQRARRLVVLGFVAVLGLVTLLLSAFASAPPNFAPTQPEAARVLPTGRPTPQVLATVSNVRIQLPVSKTAVTKIGFHSARNGAIQLHPLGRRANEGLLARLWHKIAGTPTGGPVWYQLHGPSGSGTHVLNVGAAPGTDVYAPVDGTVTAISGYVRNDRVYGARIDIRPTVVPSVIVSLTHLRPDPSLTVGSPVLATSSKLGTVIDIAPVERQALARHTRDGGNNVAIEVHPSVASLP
jgi:hypothetical protein